jgi:transcription antitermination protein NusB
MTIPPQKLREVVLQLLFSQDFLQDAEALPVELLRIELGLSRLSALEAKNRALAILEKRSILDLKIVELAGGYALEKIHPVERNILRIGTFEILFDEKIPDKVAISEAIRLSCKFSSKNTLKFVNAVLDALYKQKQGEQINAQEIKASFLEYLTPDEN